MIWIFIWIINLICLGDPQPDPLASIAHSYRTDLEAFLDATAELDRQSRLFAEGVVSLADLRTQLSSCRTAFKRTEVLMEYMDPDAVKKLINGAPLPRLEPHVPEVSVLEPNGLQTLDELIFSDEAEEQAEYIARLSTELLTAVTHVTTYQRGLRLEHRQVFEACRLELIRIYTLGLTGFDTPGSQNALAEAMTSLEAVDALVQTYAALAENKGCNSVLSSVQQILKEGISLLHQADFETLDRLAFLRNVIDPAFLQLKDAQSCLQIEFADPVDASATAVNLAAESLFADDLLNPSFYAEVAASDLLDPAKVALGEILFFDPVLSSQVTMACASCHHPEKAFTDGLPTSVSAAGGVQKRNTPSLMNCVYSANYFWDMREYDLERQVKHVVYNTQEFNMDFLDLADRLKESDEYNDLFRAVYGDRDKYGISSWSISNALAAYVASLRSWNSTFDKYVRGETDEIDASVQNGYNLFMGKASCGTCHFAPTFAGTVPPLYQDSESEVLGVPVQHDTLHPVLDDDFGRVNNGLPADRAPHLVRSFKTVTVRNAELTAPYMHNGAYQSLEDVLDFYNRGGGAGLGLDVPFQTLPDTKLDLSKQEAADIIAFIKSLTDVPAKSEQPDRLPQFENHPEWNHREIGGSYVSGQ